MSPAIPPHRRARALPWSVAAVLAVLAAGVVPAPAHAVAPERTPVVVRLAGGDDAGAVGRAAAASSGRLTHVFDAALTGFAASLPPQAIEALRRNPRVLSIEPDVTIAATGTQTPTPSWGLDRVDQARLPLGNSFSWGTADGRGVTAYVIDTGMRTDHNDFSGRVRPGFTAVSDGAGTGDCHGHGTHVAGTVGGTRYGVAKAVTLVPVRVLGCDGTGLNSQVLAGLDWVVKNHQPGTPAVANVSLSGPASPALDAAVQALMDDGVTVSVAAGNSGTDACTASPGRLPSALTVGATTRTDSRAGFSNYGRCLDVFAPGESIVSTAHTSTTASATMSGTSMAAPHVTGRAAQVLSQQPTLTPAGVVDKVKWAATMNILTNVGPYSPNRLLRTS